MSQPVSFNPYYAGDVSRALTYWSYYPNRVCNNSEVTLSCPSECAKRNSISCAPFKGSFLIIPLTQFIGGEIKQVLDMNIGGNAHLWPPGPFDPLGRQNQIFQARPNGDLVLSAPNITVSSTPLFRSIFLGIGPTVSVVNAIVPDDNFYLKSGGKYFNFDTLGWVDTPLRACNALLLDPFIYEPRPDMSMFYRVNVPQYKSYASTQVNLSGQVCQNGKQLVNRASPYGCTVDPNVMDDYFIDKYQGLFNAPISGLMNEDQKQSFCNNLVKTGKNPFDVKYEQFCGDPLNAKAGAIDARMNYCAQSEDKLFSNQCTTFITDNAINANGKIVHPVIQTAMNGYCQKPNLSKKMADSCSCFWGPKEIIERQTNICSGLGLTEQRNLECRNSLFGNQPVNCWAANCRSAPVQKYYSDCNGSVACINVVDINNTGKSQITVNASNDCSSVKSAVDAFRNSTGGGSQPTGPPSPTGPSTPPQSSAKLPAAAIAAIILLVIFAAIVIFYIAHG